MQAIILSWSWRGKVLCCIVEGKWEFIRPNEKNAEVTGIAINSILKSVPVIRVRVAKRDKDLMNLKGKWKICVFEVFVAPFAA